MNFADAGERSFPTGNGRLIGHDNHSTLRRVEAPYGFCHSRNQFKVLCTCQMTAQFVDRAVTIEEDRFLWPIAPGTLNHTRAQIANRLSEPLRSSDVFDVFTA